MKTYITITYLLFIVTSSLSHLAEASPSPKETGILKTEWMEKIYQANRTFETFETWHTVLDENGGLLERRYIAWDPQRNRMKKILIAPEKDPQMQSVSNRFYVNGTGSRVDYFEKRTPDLIPGVGDVKDGRATFDPEINELLLKVHLFFVFDEDLRGNRFCETLKALSPKELMAKAEEIELKGRKCLRFSGPFTIVFEKERGIVLEKSLLMDYGKESPWFFQKVEYSDHQLIDGTWFPLTVHYTTQRGVPNEKPAKALCRMKPEDVKFNHKIPDEKFVPRVPKGFEVFDHVNDLYYLSTGFTRERENAIKKQLDEIFEESEK